MLAAVVLRGMSASYEGRGPMDWRACYASLNENYMEPRRRERWTIDVYYHTYHSPEIKEIRNLYKPVASKVTDFFAMDRYKSQQRSLIIALELVRGVYDEILVTRIDLLYKLPVTQGHLQDGFSVPWRDIDGRKHCDVIWVFAGKLLPKIIKDLHHLVKHPPHHNCCGGELHFYVPTRPLYMFKGRFSSDTDWPERFP